MGWLADALPVVLGVLAFVLVIAFTDGMRTRRRRRPDKEDQDRAP